MSHDMDGRHEGRSGDGDQDGVTASAQADNSAGAQAHGAADEQLPVSADRPLSAGQPALADQTAPVDQPVPTDQLAPTLEALLLMAEEPIDVLTLGEATNTPVAQVERALEELSDFYDQTGRGFQLRQVGGGWRYYTRDAQHDYIAAWVKAGGQNRLTQAAMETLAVIAYLQPVPRSRVSAVRGVNVDGVVRTLLTRGLVDEQGADEQTGAGLLVTTSYFLSRLGLADLSELPDIAPLLPDAATLEAELVSLAKPGAQEGTAPQADASSKRPKGSEPSGTDSSEGISQ